MGFRALLITLLLALPALPGAGDGLRVLRADLRFRGDGETGSVRMEGDVTLTAGRSLADPSTSVPRVTLGPVTLLEGGLPPVGSRVRRRPSGDWVLTVPRAFGGSGRVRLDMNPLAGIFRLEARGFDARALLAAGPAGVDVTIAGDGDPCSDAFDLDVPTPRRWSYRFVFTPDPPGPGDGGDGSGGGGGGGAPVPIQTLAFGDDTTVQAFRFLVVKDDASWQALWPQFGSGPAPSVDFRTEMVIGFWAGARNSSGYEARILGVTGANAPPGQTGAFVTLEETRPGPNCPNLAVMTSPYHVVKTQIRGDVVTYEYLTRLRTCP